MHCMTPLRGQTHRKSHCLVFLRVFFPIPTIFVHSYKLLIHFSHYPFKLYFYVEGFKEFSFNQNSRIPRFNQGLSSKVNSKYEYRPSSEMTSSMVTLSMSIKSLTRWRRLQNGFSASLRLCQHTKGLQLLPMAATNIASFVLKHVVTYNLASFRETSSLSTSSISVMSMLMNVWGRSKAPCSARCTANACSTAPL